MSTPEVLKALIDKGLTQEFIAKELGCHQGSISRWMMGSRKIVLKYAIPLVKLARRKGIKVKVENFLN